MRELPENTGDLATLVTFQSLLEYNVHVSMTLCSVERRLRDLHEPRTSWATSRGRGSRSRVGDDVRGGA